MTNDDREETFEQFRSGNINIVVGTDAMCVGIHFDVDHVIMFGMPSSIESLWQKAGRAGRNSDEKATVHIYWSHSDIGHLTWRSANLTSIDDREALKNSTLQILK